MRLFTGVELPEDVSLDLKMMQSGIAGAQWIDAASFHITLRFIGDIEDGLAREVAFALGRLETKPFNLAIKGFGVFGGKKPHALIALLEENADLLKLHLAQERLCQSLGLVPEPRKFIPHVTLAVLGDLNPLDLGNFIEKHALYRSRKFLVERFVLFSARSSRRGGPYVVEESYVMVGT